MKILVTGKDGQLAQSINSIAPFYSNFEFVFKSSSELDITNRQSVLDIFSQNNFDYCINCAAYTAVDLAESHQKKAYDVNVLGQKNLATACKKNNVVFIGISTDFVFDGSSKTPYKEIDKTNPLGIYGKTKLQGELAVSQQLDSYFIIRTSWLYSEFGKNFMKTMLRLASQKKELGVVGDQVGSPTYAVDLAKVILSFISQENSNYGIYHYSNAGECSWYDFAKEIFKQSSKNIKLNKIKSTAFPTAAKRPKYSVLDTTKIQTTLGLQIPNWKTSLKQALLILNEN